MSVSRRRGEVTGRGIGRVVAAAGTAVLALSLAACGSPRGITANTTCADFLSNYTSSERADAVARLAIELDVPSAANPLVALTVAYDCGYLPDRTVGSIISGYSG